MATPEEPLLVPGGQEAFPGRIFQAEVSRGPAGRGGWRERNRLLSHTHAIVGATSRGTTCPGHLEGFFLQI